LAIDEAWKRWKSRRDEHRIFWEFIDDVRNSILKEFELRAGQGVIVRPGSDHMVTYPVYLEGFDVQDQVELLERALDWWRAELDLVEARASEIHLEG
jgi:cytolysin (calcineurin-like family phosphatase)